MSTPLQVAVLTGGRDKPYALGIAEALSAQGMRVDLIGGDDLDVPQLHRMASLKFFNFRGDQREDVSYFRKVLRVLTYYSRLIRYAVTAQPKIFHVLWNNKFELFDRTLLMLYYKLVGKRIAFTAHNVNAGKRDAKDSLLNRITLKIQYQLADHIFVHTESMKDELVAEFGTFEQKISVIPFGVNNTVPSTKLTTAEAKQLLGVEGADKTLLFFGNIAPYKGLECLIAALAEVLSKDRGYRLIIAGKATNCVDYWNQIKQAIMRAGVQERIIERIEFIPDDQVEVFFKAADIVVLPYSHIFQSGVLFLGYSFGLPVIASDVGSLREDVVESKTGYTFRPKDSHDLARAIERYFSSPLFQQLESRRQEIRDYANDRYSWNKVGEITKTVYSQLLEK